MGFKIKKTKKQRIVGTLLFLLFAFIIFCICYFLTFFFTLSSTTHEGQKIIESDWKVIITDGYGYNADQGVIFTFKDNGRYSIKYEDGEKIASGFYKLDIDDDTTNGSSGVIKLLSVPFIQNFPDEWEMSELRTDIDFKFIYTQYDNEKNIIYKDRDNNIMSDTMEFQTTGTIFKVTRDGSEEAKSFVTSTSSSSDGN